jgi:AraC-like DNA-binding protein
MSGTRALHERTHPSATVEIGLLAAGGHYARSEADEYELCMVVSGAARDRRQGSVIDHGPGAVTLNLPGWRPAFEPVEGALRYVSVVFSQDLVGRVNLERAEPFHARSDPRLAALLSRIAHESQELDDIADIIVEGLLLETLGAVARSAVSGRCHSLPWVRQLHDRICADPAAQESIADLAAEIGYTPDHIAKTYRAVYGCSIGEARRNARLRLAADLLDMPEGSVAEIAVSAGFYDQAHLSRWFGRRYGMTPLGWRRRNGAYRSRN